MSTETKVRVASAFRAMKGIGISEDKVKPVLKKLLKLFDKNWEMIEEENYRALADAIFEREEAEAAESSFGEVFNVNSEKEDFVDEEAQATEEPEQPLKRSRLRYRDGQTSSSNMPNYSAPNEEIDELSKIQFFEPNGSQGLVESPQPIGLNMGVESQAVACQSLGTNKGKQIIFPESLITQKNTAPSYALNPSNEGDLSSRNGTIKEHDEGHQDSASQYVDGLYATANGLATPNELINGQLGAISAGPMDSSFTSLNGSVDSQFDHGTNSQNQKNRDEETNDLNLSTIQIPELIKSLRYPIDISKGQENIKITLKNEINDQSPPPFFYILENTIFHKANVDFSLSLMRDDATCSSCIGDCLSLSTHCACANETGFAYTTAGVVKEELLKECIDMKRDPKKHRHFFCEECVLERAKNDDSVEPCQGHLVRKFIKECWLKCGCGKQCGNRVVQRGISRKLEVFMTPGGKGWGLRTLEDLPIGAFVCEYVGEILTSAEQFDRFSRGENNSHPVLLDADWGAKGAPNDEEALYLDATCYGNVARFINHRCHDATLVEIPVEIDTPDHNYYHLALFTTREVKAMEELTWDYGIGFDDEAFSCECGSSFCRNIRRSSRSRSRR